MSDITFRQLVDDIQKGLQPTVTFQGQKGQDAGIEGLELYAEPGMRAVIIKAERLSQDDGCSKITVDYSPFDAFNQSLETANYFDSHGQAVLTARQANKYQTQETFYVATDDKVSSLMIMEEDASLDLMRRWKKEAPELRYVAFLEKEVTRLTSTPAPTGRTVKP